MGGMRGGSGGRMPMMGGSRAGGRMPMMGGARGRSADPDSMGGYGAQGNMDPSYDPDYGQASIGVSELVSGTITFDYLIYVGDEIKLNKR